MNFGQTYYEDYPDEIAALNGSRLCMQYSNSKGAGVEYSGYFGNSTNIGKIIYLAFPLESTADDKSFNNVVSKAIEYFNSVKVSVHETDYLATDFKLEQNYPNPFNPTTIINYQIAASSYVTLKVFDLLGREVTTLVNEFKQAGYYNVQLSTNNYQLSSGIYFYRLKAGSFIATKKFVLMK
ncbi:MAG: T9SS type A sorting domain-containing protein [Ignavibacteriales bacterium]|nr:T9SS type A sorting domain-containing protein [Ignavibacteriales bacterium]